MLVNLIVPHYVGLAQASGLFPCSPHHVSAGFAAGEQGPTSFQHRGVRFKGGVHAVYDLRCVVCGGWCVVVRWDACAVYNRVNVRCKMHGAL